MMSRLTQQTGNTAAKMEDTADTSSVLSSDPSEQGGARLDARLDDLSLESSPASAYVAPRYGQGIAAPEFAEDTRAAPSNGTAKDFQVGNGHDNDDDDVFTGPSSSQPMATGSGISPPQGRYEPQRNAIAQGGQGCTGGLGFTGPGFSSNDTSGFSPGMHGFGGRVDSQPSGFLRPRASDLGNRHQVAGVDAQAFYPPTACVFVANLPEAVTDNRLEATITRVFSKFGVVFVKIRRDQKNLPFAFCQYTKNEDAKTAMMEGKGSYIEGRACRTEMVKANRSFVMFSIHGREISIHEAEELMILYGGINHVDRLHPEIEEVMNIQGAVLVEFTEFDPARDVIAAYRHHPEYRVVAYDLKKATQGPKQDPDEAYLERYNKDRKSIFVGGLPVDMENLEEAVTEVAEEVGDVISVQVIRKGAPTDRIRPVAFAFVEFARPNMADIAVKRLRGTTLAGHMIRVERKNARDMGDNRRVRTTHYDLTGPLRPEMRAEMRAEIKTESEIETLAQRQDQQRNRTLGISGPSTPSRPTPSSTRASSGARLSSGAHLSSASAQHGFDEWNSGSGNTAYTAQSSYGMNPYASQAFTSPGYGSSPGYQTQTGPGTFPATPQGTPGITSPFNGAYSGGPYSAPFSAGGTYYPPPYQWATPYIQDPVYPLPFYQATYGSAAMRAGPRDSGGAGITTPTKATTGQAEFTGGSSEGDEGAKTN